MSNDTKWRINDREWFDPEQRTDGFASVVFEFERHPEVGGEWTYFGGGLSIHNGGEALYLDMDFGLNDKPENRADGLRINRNKIAVLRRMLGVAEEALDRFEAETKA